MEVVLGILECIAAAVLVAGFVWLWRKAKTFLDTQDSLEEQVQQRVLAVVEAKRLLAGNELTVDDNGREIDTLRNMVIKDRLDRTTDYGSLQEEMAKLRTEVDQLATRLKNLEDDIAPMRAELALPDPVFSPATIAETAEALKSLQRGGIESWQGPG